MGYFRAVRKRGDRNWRDGYTLKEWKKSWNRKDRKKWRKVVFAEKFEDIPVRWNHRHWGMWEWW